MFPILRIIHFIYRHLSKGHLTSKTLVRTNVEKVGHNTSFKKHVKGFFFYKIMDYFKYYYY